MGGMAGDWIPISVDLPGKPEVARLAASTRRSPDEIVGMLIRFWIWAQSHTADGFLHGMDLAMTAAVSHVPAWFLAGLCQVGWLTISENGLCIPNFDRWFGGAAKRRLQDRLRKRHIRSRPQSVRKMSASEADKMRTREERDKEKKEEKEEVEARAPPSLFIKPSIEEVAAYCKARGNTVDPEAFWAFYESNGWKVGRNPMKDWQAAVRTWERRTPTATQGKSDNVVIGKHVSRFHDGVQRPVHYFTGDDSSPDGSDATGETQHTTLLGAGAAETQAGAARAADG